MKHGRPKHTRAIWAVMLAVLVALAIPTDLAPSARAVGPPPSPFLWLLNVTFYGTNNAFGINTTAGETLLLGIANISGRSYTPNDTEGNAWHLISHDAPFYVNLWNTTASSTGYDIVTWTQPIVTEYGFASAFIAAVPNGKVLATGDSDNPILVGGQPETSYAITLGFGGSSACGISGSGVRFFCALGSPPAATWVAMSYLQSIPANTSAELSLNGTSGSPTGSNFCWLQFSSTSPMPIPIGFTTDPTSTNFVLIGIGLLFGGIAIAIVVMWAKKRREGFDY